MKNYKELSQEHLTYIRGLGGHWNLTECDQKNNKFNRAIIRALKRENPHVFLVDRHNSISEYKKGMVYNFSCMYVTTDLLLGKKIWLSWV